MQFDPSNKIVKLCTEGMMLEGAGKIEEAYELFQQAWNESSTYVEKCISAHYVARHQKNIADKLRWDQLALDAGLQIPDEKTKAVLPSLYLNMAKCYEDLNDPANALKYYELADSCCNLLPDDGYGKMIKGGISNGMERVTR